MDFSTLSYEDLRAALAEKRTEASTLFALTEPTVEQANEAEALVASIHEMETELAKRDATIAEAGDRFAAARDAFAAMDEEDPVDAGAEDAVEASEDDGVEASVDDESDADEQSDEADDADSAEVVTAAVDPVAGQRTRPPARTAARTVGRKTKRPAAKATPPVTITAGADIAGVSLGSTLDDMEAVTKALMSRVKGFNPWNKQAAAAVRSQSGGEPVISKFGVASFHTEMSADITATEGNDYRAVRNAFKARNTGVDGALTAAGWCAPSETVYSFIADYVVDGLITVPEVSAPRGGLLLTTGPARTSQGTDLDDFGWTQTEAQAIARTQKPLESIVCPAFVDHRLDAIGYGYTIPILTQKAYPELVTDALRFASVLYAHRVNRRIINDLVALSTAVPFEGYGPSMTDSLEVLSIVAVKERRRWNIGENAVMEVKLPAWVREVFRADMSRRAGLALDDVATDQKIDAHFTARRLQVEYVADWAELPGVNAVLPGVFPAMIYPHGTFIKALEDVVNLSAIYDAASLTVNEYTGVFFEQAIMTALAGYGSRILSIPVNTAGETGALTLTGAGDAIEGAGSF